ncbi:S-Ena type endospore appendage [Paenibacillus hodogayensis]|uniref:S-Ena type endospore appendage n=1 Tax=Paenibacillus hodogayensis TaxID=279208 RepID=A0ABV5VYN0_9BACL
MSCSDSTASCCQKPILSVCLPQQNFTVTTGATLFGPNPSPVAASGVISNDSAATASLTVTFRRGNSVVATFGPIAAGQARAFAVGSFTSISATSTSAGVATLCMTEFFRPNF